MATGTVGSTYNTALRVVGGELVNTTLHENLVYELIKDKTAEPQNVKKENKAFYWYHNVKTGNGNSGRNISETGNRPTFYPATLVPAKWALKLLWQPINLTGFDYYAGGLIGPPELTIESAELQSLADGWNLLMSHNLLYQATQQLAQISDSGSSTSIYVYDSDLLDVGMVIDIYRWSGTAWSSIATAMTITNLDRETYAPKTLITVGSNSTPFVANTDYVMLSSQYNTGIDGLGDLINNGADITYGNYVARLATDTYGNMARSTYGMWKATVYQPAGAGKSKDFDPVDVWSVIAKIGLRQGTGLTNISCGLAHPYTIAAIIEKLQQLRVMGLNDNRIVYGSDKKVEIASPMCKGGSFFLEAVKGYRLGLIDLIDTPSLRMRWVEEPNFVINENGNIFHRIVNDAGTPTDEWRGSFMGYLNMIGYPHRFGCLAGINLPSGLQPW